MSKDTEMNDLSCPDFFHIDDLLDFSNQDLFSSSTTTTDSDDIHPPTLETTTSKRISIETNPEFPSRSMRPSELEWLSNFVDESLSHFPLTGTSSITFLQDASLPGKARSKQSRSNLAHHSWTSSPASDPPVVSKSKSINTGNSHSPASSSSHSWLASGRKCTHCASEKTPQWRTGPMGPKTLCNACGVRYKSGRLVPEYRPAASPTFVLTQHSNSHRKVLELRRQKEVPMEDNNHEFKTGRMTASPYTVHRTNRL
ncbi:hypothetical protein IFM89_033275 [Coptis chinensis]|uniref:GATA transcription factor n=1 Tax=Coptis chinensis TaxID=261450 RepID=A0A835M7Z3_9MAGN|nr:hypothetical protein IFM89_033275 [Coptis chinensis]